MSALYERDFFQWTKEQAAALRRLGRARANTELDLEHLAEEVEDMGRRDQRAVESHLARILEHLLKLQFSPAEDPRDGWEQAIADHRLEARLTLRDSPSLRRRLETRLDSIYREGRKLAARGLARDGLAEADLPERCPYSMERVLDPDWWPERRSA
jgi:hypothetical protein